MTAPDTAASAAAHLTGQALDDDAAAREHARSVTERSGTSFYGAMRVLPQEKREAMYAIYAYCREVDDVADDPAPPADKIRRLQEWREEVDRLYAGRPTYTTTRALLGPVRRYGLAKKDFLALIEGMEIDASETLNGPSLERLEHYCACVAGAVGLLSIRVFGATDQRAQELAWALGQALQLTNILRDLKEDAERGRLYLPAEYLDRFGVKERDPRVVLKHPNLPAVCEELALLARRRFGQAVRKLQECPRRQMRPAVVMMFVYRAILNGLIRRGWRDLDTPVRVPKWLKLWYAFRYGVL
ncbi:MAG: presqualene diphosphate synthase HpnD [Alphaproteobacteria bacterium]|nr:presqualene diphosphate synthase HpnD [Alphaproteobacteria bacterium]